MLAVLVDFVRRRLPELDVITSGGARAGLYVSDAASLRVRCARERGSSLLPRRLLPSPATPRPCRQNGVEAARSRLNADCRRDDIKPVSCVITSGESAFIQVRWGSGGLRAVSAPPRYPPAPQEFLAWHILLGWAHFVVVADVREPRPAHLRAALRPFIDVSSCRRC